MVKVNVPTEVSVHVATISRLLSDPSADGYDEAIDTALGALERVKMSTELLIASGAGKARRSHMISRCISYYAIRAHPHCRPCSYLPAYDHIGGEQATQDEPARGGARRYVEGPRAQRLG